MKCKAEPQYLINELKLSQDEVLAAWMGTLGSLYPVYSKGEAQTLPIRDQKRKQDYLCRQSSAEVREVLDSGFSGQQLRIRHPPGV